MRHPSPTRHVSFIALGLITLLIMALPAAASAAGTGISGTVTISGTSEGIEGAEVCVFESTSEKLVQCEKTKAKGEYEVATLAAGSYKVRFTANGYALQWYSNDTSYASATVVEVKSGVVTPNIGAALEETGQGSVAGRVTNTSTGQGAGGVEVCSDESKHCVETNGNGEYTLSGVAVGSHEIDFSPAETCEEEQGEKIRCQAKSNYLGRSMTVDVKANQTTTENVALQVGGQISGTVTNASITHPGIAKLKVCATRVVGTTHEYEEEEGEGCAITSSTGQYTIPGLESGVYKVKFSGVICSIPKPKERECPEAYVTQFYNFKQTRRQAEGIAVTAGLTASGINASLFEAFPTTPVAAAAPALTGTAAVGDVLTCSQGSWAHEPTYLIYQWLRGGAVISGQTGSTYALQVADQDHSITCSVTAGNGAGATSATSNAIVIPVPLAVFVGAKVKGSVASVTLRCPGPGSCSGVMKILARAGAKNAKHKASNVTIGVASFSMGIGKRVTLRVHLTGEGRKLLRQAGRRGLKVKVTGTGVKAHTVVLKK